MLVLREGENLHNDLEWWFYFRHQQSLNRSFSHKLKHVLHFLVRSLLRSTDGFHAANMLLFPVVDDVGHMIRVVQT
jgi:hypothetical protein